MTAGRWLLTIEVSPPQLATAFGRRAALAGRALTLAHVDGSALEEGRKKEAAFLTSTLRAIEGREGVSDWSLPGVSVGDVDQHFAAVAAFEQAHQSLRRPLETIQHGLLIFDLP